MTEPTRDLGPIMQILVPVSDVDRASIYFGVEDVTGTLERLEAKGAKVRERPEVVFGTDDYDLWLAFVQDPDGNNIGLMREAPKGTQRG
jgi:predicted enzyme related to lactoylglutathione lyase